MSYSSSMKTVLIQCRLPEPKAKKLAEIAKRESRSKSAQVKVYVEKCLDTEQVSGKQTAAA